MLTRAYVVVRGPNVLESITKEHVRYDVHTLETPTKDQNWPTNPVT